MIVMIIMNPFDQIASAVINIFWYDIKQGQIPFCDIMVGTG